MFREGLLPRGWDSISVQGTVAVPSVGLDILLVRQFLESGNGRPVCPVSGEYREKGWDRAADVVARPRRGWSSRF